MTNWHPWSWKINDEIILNLIRNLPHVIAVLGGSFSILHSGHKALIRRAFEVGDSVVLGLTTDEYVHKHKVYNIGSYGKREKNLINFMSTFSKPFTIRPLESREGALTTSPDLDILVVSQETAANVVGINEIRRSRGLKQLSIEVVPLVLAEDLFPISSTRVNRREIRSSGKRVQPVKISISTENDLKVSATNDVFRKIMKNFTVQKFTDYSLDTDQPFGEDTEKYATTRAISGLRDNDYSIGVESGVFYNSYNDIYYDVHVAAIIDRQSRITVGYSSGFEIPPEMVDSIKRGYNEKEAFLKIYGNENNLMDNGIAGSISNNTINRKELIGESIRNALVPRLAPLYYQYMPDSHYRP